MHLQLRWILRRLRPPRMRRPQWLTAQTPKLIRACSTSTASAPGAAPPTSPSQPTERPDIMGYLVQNRRRGGKWTTRWELANETQAVHYYISLNTFGNWRKRLVDPDGKVVARQEW